jgi:predicted O-methyltransferase YrrM
MRDPVAIVSRLLAARAIGPDKTKASLLSAMRMYQDILAYVDKTNRPVLYISYEKAITDRKAAAEAIAEFAGSRSPEGIVAAASTITPNSPDYLQAVSRAIASGRSGHSTVRTAPIHRERKVQRPSVKEPNRARAEPLTTPNDRTVETIRTLFPHIGEKPMVIAEVGIGKGATATKIAELMNGKGELYLFDFNERVERVGSLLRSLGYQNVVTHGFTRALWDSYNWPLMKLIEAHKEPIFDFVSLDGTHTWLHDGLAFFLIDRLLKVGGYLDFNDYSWSYEWSAKYHNRPLNLDRMTEEQARTKQVKCVVDLLVKRDPRYKAISEDKVYQKA